MHASELKSAILQNIELSTGLELDLVTGKQVTCLPVRLVYIKNELNLIAEDQQDHNLACFPIESIARLRECPEGNRSKSPKSSTLDIDHFVDGLKSFHEEPVRVILKFYNGVRQQDLENSFHLFRKPCLIETIHGDFIWSAYFERGEELHQWLIQLWRRNSFEILYPLDLSYELANFVYNQALAMGKAG